MRMFSDRDNDENNRNMDGSMEVMLQQLMMIDRAQNFDEMRVAVDVMLRVIGDYTNAGRVYIFNIVDDSAYHNEFEWCRKGVLPQKDNLQHVLFEEMPYWHNAFKNSDSIIIHDVERVKDIMPKEYELLKIQGIKSVIAFPIYSRRTLKGFIGIDDPEITRTEPVINLLAVVGTHIKNALESMHVSMLLEESMSVLKQRNEELLKEKHILGALCADYAAAYYLDLASGVYEILKLECSVNASRLHENSSPSGDDLNYLRSLKQYYDNYVVKSASPDFLERLSIKNFLKELRDKDRFVYDFQVRPNMAGQEYFEVCAMRPPDSSDPYKILMGFRAVDETVRSREKQRRELEDALADACFNNEVVSAISRIYLAIYDIDLQNDLYEEISSSEKIHRLTGHSGRASLKLAELLQNIVNPEYLDRIKSFFDVSDLQERMKNEQSIAAEYPSSDGQWHLVRFIEKKRDKNGMLTNVLFVVRVVSDEKVSEYNWMIIAEQERRANKIRMDFLSRISHDLRTPLNAVMGIARIAETRTDDPEFVKENLLKIKRAGGYISQMVDNLLDMSNIEKGTLTLAENTVAVSELIENLKLGIHYVESYRKLELIYDIHDILHECIIVDRVRLDQIYINIFSNAVKFTPDGGTVKFDMWQEESSRPGMVKLIAEISDTGIGMSEEFMKSMYDEFSREVDTRLNTVRGSGLGLTVVKQLTDLMHGKIDVKSSIGKGTVFKVTFELPYAEEGCADDAKASGEADDDWISGLSLLVAEDNDLNYDVVSDLLAMYGIKTERAENGAICAEKFAQSPAGTYDAILMDMQMPVMNGLEAARSIRALDHSQAAVIPIIAMTANTSTDDIESCYTAGMNEHLPKPLDIERLIDVLKSLLGGQA